MTIETIATNTTDNTEEMHLLVDEHCIEIKDNMKSAQKKFIRLCEMILEKGYSPGEAWTRIKENLKEYIPERTLYRWADTALPEESKLVTKPKKIANWQSPKQETKLELPNNDFLYNKIDLLKRENAHFRTQLQLPTNDSDVQQIPAAVEQPGPKEIQGRHNIAPEDYEINKLDQYDRDLLVNIIRYLHNKIQAPKKDNSTDTHSTERQDWLLGKWSPLQPRKETAALREEHIGHSGELQLSFDNISSLSRDCNLYPLHMSQQLRPQQVEYIKVQKHSENRTLMVTIPFTFAQSIAIQKGDTVRMTLEDNRRIIVERTTD